MTSAWPNLQDLLVSATDEAPVGLVGAPLGTGSVTPGRCDLAPGELRRVLRRIGRYDLDTGNILDSLVADRGDVSLESLSIEQATAPIRDAVAASVARHALTILIGGNNAVTRPGLHGFGLPLERVGLITLDTHFDMRATNEGLSNGNPVRALIEDGLPGRNIAQIGLAPFANSRTMHQDALAAGNLVITASYVHEHGIERQVDRALLHLDHVDAIYVDCDIDVIDRSQFPAAPGGRPGGMSAIAFFAASRRLAAASKVRAIDLTEWDPPLDPSDLSALTAGRWLAEVLAGFEERS